MKISRKVGTTSEILHVFVRDSSSTTGGGLTGLTSASSGLTGYYCRNDQGTATSISIVTMTLGTYTSGGFKELDATNMPGWYQFCPPNGVFTSGRSCALHLKGVTNMAPLPIEVELTAVDNQSATSFITAVNGIAQTGDSYARLGAPAGANQAADIAAIKSDTGNIGTAGAGLTALGDTRIANLDATVSSRTKPADTQAAVTTVTNLTNAPTSGDLTATMKASVTTAATAATPTAAAVTGAVGSVTGNVGGNVVGSVASVTAGVTVTTNNDKTGYALTAAYDLAKTAAQGGDAMTLTIAYDAAKTASQLDAAGVRSAVGLASANLDTQLAAVTPLSAAGVRSAVGLASANLDTQLGALAAPGDAMTLTGAYDFAKGTAAMTEDYAAKGAPMSAVQAIHEIRSLLAERSISGTTLTGKKLDGATPAATYTLDDAVNPSAQTRAT